MKESLLELLVCPRCHGASHALDIRNRQGHEILEGYVSCECGQRTPIVRGVLRAVNSDAYVSNFSFEWQLHRKTQLDSPANRRSSIAFQQRTGLDPADFHGKRVLDIGVGTGRFADVLARAGAQVTGIDLSYAVETAMENVGHRPETNIVQADLFQLPFAPESFDLIYSIGVLHHTPDCQRAFQQLVPLLKPGGTIAIWVYNAHVWSPGSLLETTNSLWRAVTTRLPNRLLYALCLAELPLYYLRKLPWFDKSLHLLLPGALYHAIPKFNDHPDVREHVLDVFDWFSPTYQSKHTYPEVFQWFEQSGLERIRIMPDPVGVSGQKPARATGARHDAQRIATTRPKPAPLPASTRSATAEPLRVMHFLHALETGGLENGVVNICNQLDPHRFEPSISVLHAGAPLEERLDKSRVGFWSVNRRFGNDPGVPVRLAALLRRERIQILHTHSWVTLVEGMLAARLAGVPVVVHGEHGPLATRKRHVWFQRWLWPHANVVTATSAELADAMSETVGFPCSQIQVIANGVDTHRFCPRPAERSALRRKFELAEHGLMLGMVARLVPLKNHAGVLQALAQLHQSGLDVHLAVAGDGPLRAELRAQAATLGVVDRLFMLGEVQDVPGLLNALDVFVLNSDSEGMSNSILEAMACGLPVVATAVGSNPALVAESETGVLVPPADSATLTTALRRLLDDARLRDRLGGAGRRKVCLQHSVDHMVQAYAALYERLLLGSPPLPSTGFAQQFA